MPPDLDSSQTAADVDVVLADYMRRIDAGEQVDQAALLAAHPQHADELRKYFSHAAMVTEAMAAGATVGVSREATPRNAVSIRCPHCHAPAELAVDAPLADLTCDACGSQFSLVNQHNPTRTAPLVTKIGRFELVERLGVGGFGTVWKARDRELDRTVAIKIPRQGGMSPDEVEEFFREARVAAQLRHPSIVSVHDIGRDGESVYIVSDFVRGVNLDDWLTVHQLTCEEAADLCAKIADALHHAHENGVVHRDLKPANIMIDGKGEPHLMDFGLARRDVGEVAVTTDGRVLGTPAYMSPEQAQGEAHAADRRSDVYSLGVILFRVLTGELPFRGSVAMLLHQVIHDEPPSPRKLNGNIPRDLETITLKCLEKEPGRRYDTALAVAQELERYRRGDPLRARPPSRLGRLVRLYSHTADAIVLTAGGFAVVASIILILWEFCGILLILSDRMDAPRNQVLKMAVFALVVHPLLLFAGIATINKSVRGLLLGTVITCAWAAMLVLAALNVPVGVLQLDILSGAVDASFYRYQFIILFLIVAALGALVHLLAVAVTFRKSSK
jgi:hypothetical protein